MTVRLTGRQLRELRATVWDRSDGRCHYCGKLPHPIRDFTVDHVVPISRGGNNDPRNLVACCVRCNSSKGARLAPIAMVPSRSDAREAKRVVPLRKSRRWPVEEDATAAIARRDRVANAIVGCRDSGEVMLFSTVAKRAGLQPRVLYENCVLTATVRKAKDEQMTAGIGPEGWTIMAVAAWLQVTRATVMRWIARGHFVAFTDAMGTLRVGKNDLDAWLDSLGQRPARSDYPT